jgi:hypothetical protein
MTTNYFNRAAAAILVSALRTHSNRMSEQKPIDAAALIPICTINAAFVKETESKYLLRHALIQQNHKEICFSLFCSSSRYLQKEIPLLSYRKKAEKTPKDLFCSRSTPAQETGNQKYHCNQIKKQSIFSSML